MNTKRMMTRLLAMLLLLALAFCITACKEDTDPSKDEMPSESLGMYTVKYQDTAIELGKDATAVLTALGEPSNKQYVASCGEGAGDQWRYSQGL